MYYVWLLLAALGELVGDILLKVYTRNARREVLVASVVLYFAGAASWLWALRGADLGKSIVAFTAVFLVAGVAAGFFLGEKVSLRLCLGVLLAVLSLYLVEAG